METIRLNTEYLQQFLDKSELAAIEKEVTSAKNTLINGTGKGNDFLGWVNLPADISSDELSNIKKDVARLSGKAQLFVVVGIGGSYLGARAVIEALQSEFAMREPGRKHPFIVYSGHTLSEDYYCQLMQMLDGMDYAVAVISKSGTTTEPAVAFRIIKSHIEKKYGREEAANRIIAITDARRGALHDIAVQEGYRMYVIPDNVGGRFSVLTPVGLLPIAMSGYNIDQLLQGARDRVPEKADYTNYTINRVGEISLNRISTQNSGDTTDEDKIHGNYFGIYSVVNYLGNLTSDVRFNDVRTTDVNSGSANAADGVTTYKEWKIAHKTKNNRNNGTSKNKVALASGVYLEIINESTEKR